MKKTVVSCLLLAASLGAGAQVQTEKLTRGVVAVKTDNGTFVSWRSLVTDDASMTFDVYRDGVKVNDMPISRVTNLSDAAAGSRYEVRAIVNGKVVDSEEVTAWNTPYMRVHLDRPAGGTVQGSSYTFSPDDISIGDVDGDGIHELFVKWVPSNAKDSASKGFTGPTIIDCYRLDGTRLWRIDLGHNIRSGNHYTQFMVYDFDGDGCAEMICKTAPGTKDGKGNWVLMEGDKETDDYRMYEDVPAKILGKVRGGSEYLTCFSGKTGEELSTIAYKPGYEYVSTSIWGDNYCNRSDRYLAGVAYLDGKHPSAIFARGYYRCAFVWAVDFKDGKLQQVWFHESKEKGKGLWGEGAHALTVGDVDADGKDEIIYGAGALDHDGTLLYRTNPCTDNTEGHGDALHLTRMLPEREGLQVFMPHESKTNSYPFDTELRDARTGEIIYMKPQSGKDIGRGIAANVSSRWPGHEYWAASDASVYNHGEVISQVRPPINFRIYWDGDLLDELLDGTAVSKPDDAMTRVNTVMDFGQYNTVACNGTKNTPNLQADFMGDWREEVILHDPNCEDLLIFTTTIPTNYKLPCLLQDHQYRMAIAWQNTAYNQPPHLSYCPEELYDTTPKVLIKSGATSQVVNLGDAIEPVVYTVSKCTGAKVEGLPEGLTATWDEATSTGTISGTPAAQGEWTITITTVGGDDELAATTTVNIKVRRDESLVPLAYYSFDNAGATAVNAVEGVTTAAGQGTPVSVEGRKGNAAQLDGNNWYTQPGYDRLNLGADDFTVEFWVKSQATGGYLLHKGSNARNADTGTTGNWMGIELKNDVLYFAIDDDVTKSQAYMKQCSGLFDGEWHHIVCVRDTYNKTLRLYADGAEVASGADNTGAIADNNEPLTVGNANYVLNVPFAGSFDEMYIYRGAMSAQKVAERYATTGRELAYFPFDEISESTPNLTFGSALSTGGTPLLIEGLKGGAARFASGSHFVQDAYDAIQMGEGDFTIETWMRSTDDDAYIFFKGSHSANAATATTGHWIGLERRNGYLCFAIDDNVTKTDCKLADANHAFDGNWHHIACVRDFAGKTTTLYIDGVEVARASNVATGALADNNEPLRIGISDESARTFDGDLDEMIIHGRALSPQEIAASWMTLRDAAGIGNIVSDRPATLYTVVDAMTGVIVARAYGSTAMLDRLDRGVYLLIEENAEGHSASKFIKR